MARKLPLETIQKELSEKYLTLLSSYDEYKSLNSPITVQCVNGHKIETTFKTIRSANFTCSVCVGTASKGKHVSNRIIPAKVGYRIIGFDNASHNMGVSIFDDGKLVYYNLLQFNSGTTIQRLNKIRDLLEKQILPTWSPDFVQFEGVQHQSSYATYDVLLKLQGVFEMACDRYGIPYEITRSSVWRSHFAINKRDRKADKKAAIDLVKDMYGISVTDDVAEAILITKYRSDMRHKKSIKDLF